MKWRVVLVEAARVAASAVLTAGALGVGLTPECAGQLVAGLSKLFGL